MPANPSPPASSETAKNSAAVARLAARFRRGPVAVVSWGAGGAFLQWQDRPKLAALLDSDESKWGRTVANLTVAPPAVLARFSPDTTVVVAASMYVEQIGACVAGIGPFAVCSIAQWREARQLAATAPSPTRADNDYTRMQSAFYEDSASQWSPDNRDPVVGTFDAHNAWPDYEYLWRDLGGELAKLTVLDFGCGPGRNIAKYGSRFARLDGVDISSRNLANARLWLHSSGYYRPVYLMQCNGADLDVIADTCYDVVMSTICFQHICVHSLRLNYLREFFRILKPGGLLTMQMGFGTPSPATVGYHEDHFAATSTNRGCDVAVASPDQLEQDLLAVGFRGFRHYIRPVGPGDIHPSWIFFSARKPE